MNSSSPIVSSEHAQVDTKLRYRLQNATCECVCCECIKKPWFLHRTDLKILAFFWFYSETYAWLSLAHEVSNFAQHSSKITSAVSHHSLQSYNNNDNGQSLISRCADNISFIFTSEREPIPVIRINKGWDMIVYWIILS